MTNSINRHYFFSNPNLSSNQEPINKSNTIYSQKHNFKNLKKSKISTKSKSLGKDKNKKIKSISKNKNRLSRKHNDNVNSKNKAKDIMKEKPRDPNESLFDKVLFEEIIISGIIIGLLVFGLWFYLIKHIGMDPVIARGYTMALMIIIQNIHAFNCRSEKNSVFSVKLNSNYIFLWGIIGSIILGLLVLEFEPLSIILKTHSIPFIHLLGLFGLALIILVVMELYKKVKYHKEK